jgi:hypothetical protein
MRSHRARSVDSASRLQFLQAFAWLAFGLGSILVAIEARVLHPGAWTGWVLLILLDLMLIGGLALGITALAGWTGRGLANLAFAAGSIPSLPEHSALESPLRSRPSRRPCPP